MTTPRQQPAGEIWKATILSLNELKLEDNIGFQITALCENTYQQCGQRLGEHAKNEQQETPLLCAIKWMRYIQEPERREALQHLIGWLLNCHKTDRLGRRKDPGVNMPDAYSLRPLTYAIQFADLDEEKAATELTQNRALVDALVKRGAEMSDPSLIIHAVYFNNLFFLKTYIKSLWHQDHSLSSFSQAYRLALQYCRPEILDFLLTDYNKKNECVELLRDSNWLTCLHQREQGSSLIISEDDKIATFNTLLDHGYATAMLLQEWEQGLDILLHHLQNPAEDKPSFQPETAQNLASLLIERFLLLPETDLQKLLHEPTLVQKIFTLATQLDTAQDSSYFTQVQKKEYSAGHTLAEFIAASPQEKIAYWQNLITLVPDLKDPQARLLQARKLIACADLQARQPQLYEHALENYTQAITLTLTKNKRTSPYASFYYKRSLLYLQKPNFFAALTDIGVASDITHAHLNPPDDDVSSVPNVYLYFITAAAAEQQSTEEKLPPFATRADTQQNILTTIINCKENGIRQLALTRALLDPTCFLWHIFQRTGFSAQSPLSLWNIALALEYEFRYFGNNSATAETMARLKSINGLDPHVFPLLCQLRENPELKLEASSPIWRNAETPFHPKYRDPAVAWQTTLQDIIDAAYEAEEKSITQEEIFLRCEIIYAQCRHLGESAKDAKEQTPLFLAVIAHSKETNLATLQALRYFIEWLVTQKKRDRIGRIKDSGLNSVNKNNCTLLHHAIAFEDNDDVPADPAVALFDDGKCVPLTPILAQRRELVTFLLLHGAQTNVATPNPLSKEGAVVQNLIKTAAARGNLYFLKNQLPPIWSLETPEECFWIGYETALRNFRPAIIKFIVASYTQASGATYEHFYNPKTGLCGIIQDILEGKIKPSSNRRNTSHNASATIGALLQSIYFDMTAENWLSCVTLLNSVEETSLADAIAAELLNYFFLNVAQLNLTHLLVNIPLLTNLFTLAEHLGRENEFDQIHYTQDKCLKSLLPPSDEKDDSRLNQYYMTLIAIPSDAKKEVPYIEHCVTRANLRTTLKPPDNKNAIMDYDNAIARLEGLEKQEEKLQICYFNRGGLHASENQLVPALNDFAAAKCGPKNIYIPSLFFEKVVTLQDEKFPPVALQNTKVSQIQILTSLEEKEIDQALKLQVLWQALANPQSFLWHVFHPKSRFNSTLFQSAAAEVPVPVIAALEKALTAANDNEENQQRDIGMDSATRKMLENNPALKNKLLTAAKKFPVLQKILTANEVEMHTMSNAAVNS